MYSPQIDAAVVQSHKFGQKNVLGDLTWSDLGGIRWIYETQIEWEWFTRLVKTSEKGDAMGKLGRRLVFVLLSLSLTLMGISLAVNATATNWKGKLAKQSAEKTRLTTDLDILTKAIEVEQVEIKNAQEQKASQDKSYGDRIRQVNVDLQKTKTTLAKTHTDFQAAQIKFQNDLKVQEQVTANLKKLHAQIAALEKQKSSFVTQNEELNDLVSQLEREVQELTRSESILKSK